MTLTFLTLVADAAPPVNQTGEMLKVMGPMALVMVIFYVMMFSSQKKRQKELDENLKALKPNDRIVTSSGIVGVVVSVKEDKVSIRSEDSKLLILKSAITERRSSETPAGETAAPAKA